uniref:Uncharacterized protein n=1 Tax=candidate division WOR-3 bacterium TaxID=2052148 RepID=A0A7V3KNW7_UNCW3
MVIDKKDWDEELRKLKEEIEKIVGKEEIERIKEIVKLSCEFDDKPQYKITYNVVEGDNDALPK